MELSFSVVFSCNNHPQMEFGGYKGTGPRVRVRRRAELGRRLTRRLSLVAKMPAAILSKANPPEPRPVEITAIAPDKTHLTVLVVNPRNFGKMRIKKYQRCIKMFLRFAGKKEEERRRELPFNFKFQIISTNFCNVFLTLTDGLSYISKRNVAKTLNAGTVAGTLERGMNVSMYQLIFYEAFFDSDSNFFHDVNLLCLLALLGLLLSLWCKTTYDSTLAVNI
ncbi:hypothetical protein WN51_11236 [Melipona quadrifasciata]|uniref:Uncharacterized protein n=1 Tax=Melipona quadrifasciata TaxID=166423 RepID=A0A0M9A5X7_9HYME|nr:hypothetical protein WN51_11236 [Melipona quadrifasciata]